MIKREMLLKRVSEAFNTAVRPNTVPAEVNAETISGYLEYIVDRMIAYYAMVGVTLDPRDRSTNFSLGWNSSKKTGRIFITVGVRVPGYQIKYFSVTVMLGGKWAQVRARNPASVGRHQPRTALPTRSRSTAPADPDIAPVVKSTSAASTVSTAQSAPPAPSPTQGKIRYTFAITVQAGDLAMETLLNLVMRKEGQGVVMLDIENG